jgi:hypothetical protein
MSQDLFTHAWASDIVELLRYDETFRNTARWLCGTVRMMSDGRCVWFRFADGGIVSIGAGMPTEFIFGLRADHAGWLELLTGGNASLNKLVRQGRISMDGDRVALMRSWKLVFLMTEAARQIAGGDRCPM